MDSIRLAEFVGLPSALGWSHVATHSAHSGARSIICFAVSGMQASAIGHEIVAIIRSTELESEQQLYDLVLNLTTKAHERGGSLSLAAGYLELDRGSWITADGVVGLQRNDRFGRVLSSSPVQMRSGPIKANDIFVLATASASGMIDDVSELFQQGYQLAGVESSLERLIRTQPEQDRSALALVECLLESEEIAEPVLPPLQSLEEVTTVHFEHPLASAPEEQSTPEVLPSEEFRPKLSEPTSIQPSPERSQNGRKVLAAVGVGMRRLSVRLVRLAPKLKNIKIKIFGLISVIAATVRRLFFALKRGILQLPWSSWRESKRVRLLALIALIAITLIVVVVLTFSWQQRRMKARAAEVVAPFKTQLLTIQSHANSNPLQAQAELAQLTSDVNEKIIATPVKSEAAELQKLLSSLREYEDTLKGEQALRSLPIFMDLQSIAPGFVTTLADGLPGMGIYIDVSKKLAILVQFDSQTTTQFDLTSLEKIQAVTLRSPTEALLLGGGVYTLDLKSPSTPIAVKPEGDTNRAATLLGSYDSYVYIFNPEKRNVFRYLVRKDGYSDPIGWLLSPLGLPADSINSLKVDGDVWLSTKDGQIKKFASGRSTSFAPTNVEPALQGPVQLYTSETDQYLYAFVPTQQRVVVLTKDGLFVKQIKSEILSGALAVAADEAAGWLYAISGSVIYQAKL